MARQTFFSFHYKRDSWRAGQVRNSGVIEGAKSAGFIDKADWESLERQGKTAIKNWIDGQMKGSSVTVVLIGAETAGREWVEYEIQSSWDKGNGLIGVYVHNIKDSNNQTDSKGADPFVKMGFKGIKTYDWVNDDGRSNLGTWVEDAYQRAQNRDTQKKASNQGY